MYNELIYKYLTDEQRQFVDDFDHSILVSASAGTGKTTTMIRKLLYLLLIKKVDITSLLVVTYTTAAASKMKHDLYQGLVDALKIATADEDISHITRQIDLLNNADIGTIHSFCNKIIKKYFYVLDIDPNYSILSNEKSKGYLMNLAMSNVFEKLSDKKDEKFYRLYENFSSARTDEKLRNAVFSLYDYLVCRIDSDKWAETAIEKCYALDDNPVHNYIMAYVKNIISKQRKEVARLYDMASVCGMDKVMAYAVARMDYCDKIMNSNKVNEIARVVDVEKLPNKPTVRTDKDMSLVALHDRLEEVNDVFKIAKSMIEGVVKPFGKETFREDNEVNKANAEGVYNLTKLLKAEYARIKSEKNLLDFNDLEYYACMLLQNDSVVAELKSEYSYIFVDEYQDVNPMQDKIVCGIAGSNNLYMIGDVKQSIYRFRQSSPEIFIEKYYDYKSGDVDKKLILFNKNFRSDKNILDFVNTIFDNAITKDCVGIDYRNEARLISGKGVVDSSTVYVSIIDKNAINDANDDRDDDEEEIKKHEYEGELIARKVSEIIEKGYKFSDIAILLRDKQVLARNVWLTLKKYNIPVSVTVKAKIFESAEVKILHSLLKCIYNERDDVAFTTLLKSPFINASDDELVDIRLNAKDAKTYYEACLSAEAMGKSDKVAKLRNILKELRLQLLNNSICDTIKALMEEHNIFTYFKSMPDGIEKECYIKEFLNIISAEVYEGNIARLLDYIEVIKGKDSEMVITSGADSVTLMTMHASKGLDYPVVIIGGFGEKLQKNNSHDIKISREFGIAVSGVDDSVYERIDNVNATAIALKNRKEEFEEAIRLMYVALTRPKKELYITGVVDLDRARPKNIDMCQSGFDLFALGISDADYAYFANKKDNFEITTANNAKVICDINLPDVNSVYSNGQVVLDVSKPEIVKALTKYYGMVSEDYSDISFKNSVTGILKDREVDYANAVDNFRKLHISESVTSSDAMEVGTAYHAIMQEIEYHKDIEIKKLVDNMVLQGKINAIYLPMINIEEISNAKRMVEEMSKNGEILRKETNFLAMAPHSQLIDGSKCNEDVLVQGVLDLVIEGKDEAIIIDFKTNRTRDRQYMIDTYTTQLDLYAKAYKMCYGKEVKAKYLYSFKMNELIEIK